MMRRLFLSSTLLFWLAVAGFWAADFLLPPGATPAVAADKAWTLADVARHNKASDCWMAIGGAVYDLSAYLPQHPSDPAVIRPWCGKEASEAYRTKTKGRAHSPYADGLLPKYRVGTFEGAR